MLRFKEFYWESEMKRFIATFQIKEYYISKIQFGLTIKYLLEWEE